MVDYHHLPLMEYAQGAVECALARGFASHMILYSNRDYAEGGLYLMWSEVPFEIEDKKEFIKRDLAKGSGAPVTRKSEGRFKTGPKARGEFLKVIDLNEDIEEQLADMEILYEKATGAKYTLGGGY